MAPFSPLLALFILLGSAAVAAQPTEAPPRKKPGTQIQKVRVTGVYSTLEYVAEAGDLIGMEVFIGYGGRSGHFALIQCSEGFPDKPVLVTAQISGNSVELGPHNEDSNQCPKAKFIGTVSKTGLHGAFIGDYEKTLLPRRQSYWQ